MLHTDAHFRGKVNIAIMLFLYSAGASPSSNGSWQWWLQHGWQWDWSCTDVCGRHTTTMAGNCPFKEILIISSSDDILFFFKGLCISADSQVPGLSLHLPTGSPTLWIDELHFSVCQQNHRPHWRQFRVSYGRWKWIWSQLQWTVF